MHKFESLQTTAVPRQAPFLHASPLVHALSSLQLPPLLLWLHPAIGVQLSVVHGLSSSQLLAPPGTQAPPWQVSPLVQALPSLQPPGPGTAWQPDLPSQLSIVQAFPSSQTIFWPTHSPPVHVSFWLQTLPSSQGLPSAIWLLTQVPVVGLQLSIVQGFPSLQTFELPEQPPPPQVSPVVQALPSSHGSALAAKTQLPLPGLQLSVVQGFLSSQLTALPAAQSPLLHASPCVQGLLSSQLAVFAEKMHELSRQASSVQGLSSLQNLPIPLQIPPLQTSPLLQGLPSSHAAALALCWQPRLESHLSSVQGFLSLQSMAWPLQAPPAHASPTLQALPSSHALPSPAPRC